MSKTYYVHSVYGDRIDGTYYVMDSVESVESGEALRVQKDKETEFYTEKHSYFFEGSKKACEEHAEAINSSAKENGNYGTKDWGEMLIDGKKHSTYYNYKDKTKTVCYNGRIFGGVMVSLETGEMIENEDDCLNRELDAARKLIDEHNKLVSALTTKKEEGTV